MSDLTLDLTNDPPDIGPEVESFEALFFLALQEHLAATVPEIRWIDLDVGQLDMYEDRPPVSFPCLLVDFVDTSFDGMGRQIQWAKLMIQLRIGFAPFSASNNKTPLKYRKKAITYFDLEYKLFKALQGFTAGDICQPLIRQRTVTERRDDTYRVRTVMYDTTYQDLGATPETQLVRPPMQLD